jgi:hypothetical protein
MQECRHRKINLGRDFAAGVYLSEAQNPILLLPPPLYTTVIVHTGKGVIEPERKLEWQQFTKLGRKYQHG